MSFALRFASSLLCPRVPLSRSPSADKIRHSKTYPIVEIDSYGLAIGAMQKAKAFWADRSQATFTKVSLNVPWRSIQTLLPHRMRRKLRSKIRTRQSPASTITALQTSFSPVDTLRSLQAHRWTFHDGQYLFLALLGIFSLCLVTTPGALVKFSIAALLLTSLVFPITRQFFLPFLAIAAYLIFFYTCRYVLSSSIQIISPPIVPSAFAPLNFHSH